MKWDLGMLMPRLGHTHPPPPPTFGLKRFVVVFNSIVGKECLFGKVVYSVLTPSNHHPSDVSLQDNV